MEQRLDASKKRNDLRLYCLPDEFVIHEVVPVNQYVAERDDAAVFAEVLGRCCVYGGEPLYRFADDLETSLDAQS